MTCSRLGVLGASLAIAAGLAVAGGLGGCSETGDAGPVIDFFGADREGVTSGRRGDEVVQGQVLLAFQVQGADRAVLLAGDAELLSVACAPGDADPCAGPVEATHQPERDTVYLLRATRGQGRCTLNAAGDPAHPGECAVRTLDVAVLPPAAVTLTGPASVPAGTDAVLRYEVTGAADFGLGLVGAGGAVVPCLPVSAAGAGPCVLPEVGDPPEVPATGDAVLTRVEAPLTVRAWAHNGLGLQDPGAEVEELRVEPGPAIVTFTADPEPVLSGGTVALAWRVLGADAAVVTVEPAGAADVTGCAGLEGRCEVAVSVEAAEGAVPVTFRIAATRAGQVAEAAVTVHVATAPEVVLFATPNVLIQSGATDELTLEWLTAGVVDAVSLAATPPTAITTDLSTCGRSPCAVDVADGFAGALAFTIEAAGPTGALDTDHAEVTVQAADPRLLTFEVGGHDALTGSPEGELWVPRGDLEILWTSAWGLTSEVTRRPPPAVGHCGEAGWGDSRDELVATVAAGSGSVVLPAFAAASCLRVLVTGERSRIDRAYVRVHAAPAIVSVTTTPDAVDRAAPGEITLELEIAGISGLEVTAEYLDATGAPVEDAAGPITDLVCTDLDVTGAFDLDGVADALSCSHAPVPATGGTCDRTLATCIPDGAAAIRYRVYVLDEESDEAEADTAGGEDVVVS